MIIDVFFFVVAISSVMTLHRVFLMIIDMFCL